MKSNPGKYHRRSVRLQGYDYSQAGAYFVTICVQHHHYLYGKIMNFKMRLNTAGEMVYRLWNQLPNKYPHIELDEFIVMPNHLHGIIMIHENGGGNDACWGGYIARRGDGDGNDGCRGEVTSPLHSSDQSPDQSPERPSEQSPPHPNSHPSLGQMIAYFKYQSTKQLNELRGTPGIKLWQRNYYEHIIRDENELNRIRKYIAENPLHWDSDKRRR